MGVSSRATEWAVSNEYKLEIFNQQNFPQCQQHAYLGNV